MRAPDKIVAGIDRPRHPDIPDDSRGLRQRRRTLHPAEQAHIDFKAVGTLRRKVAQVKAFNGNRMVAAVKKALEAVPPVRTADGAEIRDRDV